LNRAERVGSAHRSVSDRKGRPLGASRVLVGADNATVYHQPFCIGACCQCVEYHLPNHAITDSHNKSLNEWFDMFNVSESERQYYDFNEAWSKLQASDGGINA